MREHNKIAKLLQINNPSWTSQKVFDEARRFVGAELQHIVYGEFLPKILHNEFMNVFDLNPKSSGTFGGYNKYVKGMIRSGFATAAFRFGHTLLRKNFFFDSTSHLLHTQFNNPNLVHEPQGIEGCTRGLYERRSQGIDELLTSEVTNKLFETPGIKFSGGDFAAFNIQRGRDHGIPPYSKWLEACYGSDFVPKNFEPGRPGGLRFIGPDAASKLKDIYEWVKYKYYKNHTLLSIYTYLSSQYSCNCNFTVHYKSLHFLTAQGILSLCTVFHYFLWGINFHGFRGWHGTTKFVSKEKEIYRCFVCCKLRI